MKKFVHPQAERWRVDLSSLVAIDSNALVDNITV